MSIEISVVEKFHVRKIIPSSKFILIGNNIDGFVNVDIIEFENFSKVKEQLYEILFSIRAEGEWNLSLYQVPNEYKIKRMYGYYKVPHRGKHIFSHSYMNEPITKIEFTKTSITFFGTHLHTSENSICNQQLSQNLSMYLELIKLKII